MKCRLCGSNRFHISRLRAPDLSQLIFLHYPVRCLNCYKRVFVNFFTALLIRYASKRRQAEVRRRKMQERIAARQS
jgi:hypothetical protein